MTTARRTEAFVGQIDPTSRVKVLNCLLQDLDPTTVDAACCGLAVSRSAILATMADLATLRQRTNLLSAIDQAVGRVDWVPVRLDRFQINWVEHLPLFYIVSSRLDSDWMVEMRPAVETCARLVRTVASASLRLALDAGCFVTLPSDELGMTMDSALQFSGRFGWPRRVIAFDDESHWCLNIGAPGIQMIGSIFGQEAVVQAVCATRPGVVRAAFGQPRLPLESSLSGAWREEPKLFYGGDGALYAWPFREAGRLMDVFSWQLVPRLAVEDVAELRGTVGALDGHPDLVIVDLQGVAGRSTREHQKAVRKALGPRVAGHRSAG